jgi:enoyl-CoA hydratase
MTARYDNLVVELRDCVLWLRISRPKSRNALSRATLAELGSACAHASALPALKAVAITGEGQDAFAAGGDLKELASVRTPEQAAELFSMASGALDEVRRCPVPVVAALNGLALGGGAELALACDFRVAARHAAIGYIHARLNISSGFGGGADLMRLLGHTRALRHALTADTLSATQASALGLVDEIAREDETLEHCTERFLAPFLRQTPLVIRAYKSMAIAQRFGVAESERRAAEREWFCRTWTHEDHWSAVDKLLQKSRERAT